MATTKQLRGMSEVLTKHEQDLRENAERAQERSAKLRNVPIAPSCRATPTRRTPKRLGIVRMSGDSAN